jgi:YgiT-type zinc finger domain-containing protein
MAHLRQGFGSRDVPELITRPRRLEYVHSGNRISRPEEGTSMTCIICRHGETQPGTTTVTFHEASRTMVVNEVPAEVCENCGEAYVAEDATLQLLAIAADARRSAAVVLVRDYASAAEAPFRPLGRIGFLGSSGAAPLW